RITAAFMRVLPFGWDPVRPSRVRYAHASRAPVAPIGRGSRDRRHFVDDHLELLRAMVARVARVNRFDSMLREPSPRLSVAGEPQHTLPHLRGGTHHQVVLPLAEQPFA